MISAADVLVVATPSWKRKGLRSAKDLLTTVVVAFVEMDDSTFVAASFAAALLLVSRREFDNLIQDDDDVRFDSTRRVSVGVVVASMLV